MKKFSRFMAVILTLCLVLSIGVSAYYDGDKDQYKYKVPKINPENPAIKIDGTADLAGEWAGALKVTFDLTKENTALTVWDSGVWGGDGMISDWSDIAETSRLTWDYYILWGDDGLYMAIVCENDPTNPGPLDVAAYRGDDYDGNLMTDRHSIEIVPSDNFDELDNSPGNMYWYYFWSETNVDNFWLEGQTSGGWNSFDENPKDLGVKTASKRASTANAQGFYPYNIEIFIPWEGLQFGTDGKPGHWNFTAAEGWTFMMAMIAEDRTGDTDGQVRVTNGQGWWNYDFFTLTGPVEKIAAAEADEPAPVDIPDDTLAPVTPPPPATTPQTGDNTIIIIFMVLVIAAVLGKSKKQKI